MMKASEPHERLQPIRLDRLACHPSSANHMEEAIYAALLANIQPQGDYPPLIVRPHPTRRGWHQILDGGHRACGLVDLGEQEATCYVWPCDDATALRLLATLNRLRGEDVPGRRGTLLAALTELVGAEDLAVFLPEDAAAIDDLLALLDVDSEALLADLAAASERAAAEATRVISFAVSAEDEAVIERVVEALADTLTGPNRRGRALGHICLAFEEASDGQ